MPPPLFEYLKNLNDRFLFNQLFEFLETLNDRFLFNQLFEFLETLNDRFLFNQLFELKNWNFLNVIVKKRRGFINIF